MRARDAAGWSLSQPMDPLRLAKLRVARRLEHPSYTKSGDGNIAHVAFHVIPRVGVRRPAAWAFQGLHGGEFGLCRNYSN